jgi:Lon protease-like protein
MIGRCYVDVDGNIGSIGSLCSIVERRRLEDGKGFFIIQANSRFKIKRILKREPYLLAEVILDYEDDVHNYVDENICERLCIDVYKLLKTLKCNYLHSFVPCQKPFQM